QLREVHHFQAEGACRIDHLCIFSVDRLEVGPQAFVTSYQLSQAPLQRIDIEYSLQAKGGRYVVCRTYQSKLLQKPQPLLRKRQGDRSYSRPRRQRRKRQPCICPLRLLDAFRQLRDRGRLEQNPHRHFYLQPIANLRDRSRGQQGISPQFEEI